jgi:flagellar hook assembly protein FlgD
VTTVRYEVPPPGELVRIVVYNVRGQRVAELANGYITPGYHSVQWDGINRSGNHVASGVYFIQMRTTRFVKTVKAVVLK